MYSVQHKSLAHLEDIGEALLLSPPWFIYPCRYLEFSSNSRKIVSTDRGK